MKQLLHSDNVEPKPEDTPDQGGLIELDETSLSLVGGGDEGAGLIRIPK